jgi:hypothetical protein
VTPCEKHRFDVETQVFGPNAVRFPHVGGPSLDGYAVHGVTVERGHGSEFSRLPSQWRQEIEAADALVAAEIGLQAASAKLATTKAEHSGAAAAFTRAASAAGFVAKKGT